MTTFTDIDGGNYSLKRLSFKTPSYLYEYETDLDAILRRNRAQDTSFSLETLCAAIQSKCTIDSIKSYIKDYEDNGYGFGISLEKEGWPALYYAVERNSPKLVSILLQYKIDPHEMHKGFHLPLLAFAIIHGYQEALDTTEIARILLAYGVDPKIIPQDMWINFLDAPQAKPPSQWRLPGLSMFVGAESAWCRKEQRVLLAKSLHLTHRYLLNLAHKLKKPNARTLQVAIANKRTDLARLSYYLIGQRPATKLVMSNVFSDVALKRETPIVMAFAGPSGHGKTELARAMGVLLSIKTTVIDCTRVTTVWGLFGTTSGWAGQDQGSQLNNFLADNNGKRSVVFLDEFDKTDKKIRDALLLVVEKGDYTNRRYNTPVNCSRTMWIIATNKGDDKIAAYYTKHLEKLSQDKIDNADMKPLQTELKSLYRNAFGSPFTGRIGLFVPFLPFTKPERYVISHKFLLDMATHIRQPINPRPDANIMIGHCRVTIPYDAKFCALLTEQYYCTEEGARSLLTGGVAMLQKELTEEYLKADGLITEDTNNGPLQEFILKRTPIGDNEYEMCVVRGRGVIEGDEIAEDEEGDTSFDMVQSNEEENDDSQDEEDEDRSRYKAFQKEEDERKWIIERNRL